MDANTSQSEYSKRFQKQADALEHYNALAPVSFTEFRARNRHVTKYFVRNIKVALRHFFEIDTTLLLEYVLCENPEYSLGLSRSIKGFVRLLECFEDLEARLHRLNICTKDLDAKCQNRERELGDTEMHPSTKEGGHVYKGLSDDMHAKEIGLGDEKLFEQATSISEKVNMLGRYNRGHGSPDTHICQAHSPLYRTRSLNNTRQYTDYVRILVFLLNRFQYLFVKEIDTVFFEGILRNFNNENTIEFLEDMFKVPNVLNLCTVLDAYRSSKFLKRAVEHQNQENSSRVLEMLLGLKPDIDSTAEEGNYSIVEDISSYKDVIVGAFLAEHRYFINVLQFKNLLEITRMNIAISGMKEDLDSLDYKNLLIVQLKVENYKNNLDLVDNDFLFEVLDLSFRCPENTFLHECIYSLVGLILKGNNVENIKRVCAYLIPRLYSFFLDYWSQEEGPKPWLSNLFPFLLDTYIVMLDLVARWSVELKKTCKWKEVLDMFRKWESEEWNTLRSGFLSRFVKKESLKYNNPNEVSEWLEDCISEPFLRYLCSVIIEDLPDHDFFHQDKY